MEIRKDGKGKIIYNDGKKEIINVLLNENIVRISDT